MLVFFFFFLWLILVASELPKMLYSIKFLVVSKLYFSQTCSLPSVLENSHHLLSGDLVKRALIRAEQHLIQINDLNARATDLLTAKQCEYMMYECVYIFIIIYV